MSFVEAGAKSRKKTLLEVVLVLILLQPAVLALTTDSGLRYAEMPTLEIDGTYAVSNTIEAEVENTGYDNVFICLPNGKHSGSGDWQVVGDIVFAKGEKVLMNIRDITAKYGKKEDLNSFIHNNFVFDLDYPVVRGDPLKVPLSATGADYCLGWYVRPNERLNFVVKLTPGSDGPFNGVFDPLYLEKNYMYSSVKVTRWTQEVQIYPPVAAGVTVGLLEAPYIVKNAVIVEAYPGLLSEKSALDKPYYFEKFKQEPSFESVVNAPSWNSWFEKSKVFSLNTEMLGKTKTGYFGMPSNVEVLSESDPIPVWLFDSRESLYIRYIYEWRRDGNTAGGIDLGAYMQEPSRVELSGVPEWYSWF